MVSPLCGYDDGSTGLHGVQILCRILRRRTVSPRCAYAHGSSNVAIERTAYHRFDIYSITPKLNRNHLGNIYLK